MNKHLPYFLRFSLIMFVLAQYPLKAQTTDKPATSVADNEYVRYRQKGDDLFKAGLYVEARRAYLNCLEVPGSENDSYATQRIVTIKQCLDLLQRADQANQEQKNTDMVDRLNELLVLNPADPLVKSRLADFYLSEGNQLFDKQQFVEAKAQYQKGLAFAQAEGNRVKQSTLELQIRNSDNRVEQLEADRKKPKITFVTPKRTGLKLVMGVLALGSGYYAYTLQNDFTTKQNAFNAIALATDPDGDGVINLPDEYQRYNKAYTEAEAAQSKRGLYTACAALAAAATITELYLLLHKAKPRQVIGFHWKPSSTSYGLAIGYRF